MFDPKRDSRFVVHTYRLSLGKLARVPFAIRALSMKISVRRESGFGRTNLELPFVVTFNVTVRGVTNFVAIEILIHTIIFLLG